MDRDGCLISFIFVFIFILGAIITYMTFVAGIPSAMDVYQGKTELEYTYRNDVAIDSVVVFKDK